MKTNEIMKSVSLTFNKVGFQLQKKSPEILVPPAWSAWW